MFRRPNDTTPRRFHVNEDLCIKRIPKVIKELIAREALQNHRSVNQEALALLEEALLNRVEAKHGRARNALAMLTSYATQSALPNEAAAALAPPTRLAPERMVSHGD